MLTFQQLILRLQDYWDRHDCALLQPPPREFEPLTGQVSLAPIYLSNAKKLLSGVDDQDIVTVLDILVDARCFEALLADIRRRKRKRHSRLNCLLAFYGEAVEQMAHPGYFDPGALQKVVGRADEEWKETLRAAARRLSNHTGGRLKEALATFDFDPLPDFMPGFPLPGFPLFDDEDDPFFDDEDEEMLDDLLDSKEIALMSLLSMAEKLQRMPLENIVHK